MNPGDNEPAYEYVPGQFFHCTPLATGPSGSAITTSGSSNTVRTLLLSHVKNSSTTNQVAVSAGPSGPQAAMMAAQQQHFAASHHYGHSVLSSHTNTNSGNGFVWRPPLSSLPFGFGASSPTFSHTVNSSGYHKTMQVPFRMPAIQAPISSPRRTGGFNQSAPISERNASIPHHHAKLAAVAARSLYLSTTSSTSACQSSALEMNKNASTDSTVTKDENSLNSTSGSLEPWTIIDIGGMGIQSVSKSLFHFDFLTTVYLNHNSLSCIPPEIGLLKHLVCLNLSSNRIKSLPLEMGKLVQLKELLLFDNLLTALPFELGSLYKLTELGLEGNPWSEPFFSMLQQDGALSIIAWLRESGPDPPKPPDRPWIVLEDEPVSQDTFTVFNYNILCNNYVDLQSFGYVPSWALSWDYRKDLIMQEILQTSADIICLQEVELFQYEEFFLENLKHHAYEGIYLQKTRAKTMSDGEKKVVDGCAIFYRSEKFKLEEIYKAEFGQLAMNKLPKSDLLYNRVMNRDNVALLGRFSFKTTKQSHQILVSNAHIHWDPAFKDVKLLQTLLLVDEIIHIKSAHPNVAVVLTGDFNSLPDSGVYEYLSKGILSPHHTDFCTYSYEPFFSEGAKHSLNLTDTYHSKSCSDGAEFSHSAAKTFTNYTATFEGVIDYIWYGAPSSDCAQVTGLILTGVYGLIPKDYFMSLSGGLPNAYLPSDHLCLMAEFKLPATTRA